MKAIAFSGSFDDVNRHFEEKGWSDGLPIVPPTWDKIEQFLQVVGRAGDEEVAVLPPANLRASLQSIAANGIMAGCRPQHMPLLVAAVEAIADTRFNLAQIGTTAGYNPFLIINGPAIGKLGLEYGTGLISRGANVAIGRALGLIVRNIAGYRPAEQQMGTFGYLLPFVLAEDEEGSPWEPFHVERGFDKAASTVTAGGTFNWGSQIFPSGPEPEGLLRAIAYQMVKDVNLMLSARFSRLQMMTVVINPSVAQTIAQGGYSKQDAADYLFHHARASMEDVVFESKYADPGGGGTSTRQLIERGRGTPREWIDLGRPNDTVPVMAYPGAIHIVVCGDRTRNKAMTLYGVYSTPSIKEMRM